MPSRCIALALALAVTACDTESPTLGRSRVTSSSGSSDGTTAPGGSGSVNCVSGRGTVTAQVDGAGWASTCVQAAGWAASVFSLAATNGPEVMTLTTNAVVPGTYNALIGAANATLTRVANGAAWVSGPGGTISIVLTRLDLQGASGSFSFTATAVSGTPASGSRIATNGTFTVTF